MKKPHLNIKLSEPLQPHIFLIMLLAGVISAIGVTMFLAPVHLCCCGSLHRRNSLFLCFWLS